MQTSQFSDASFQAGGARRSSARLWTGRVLSGIAVLFLTFDFAVKLLRLPSTVEIMAQLGYPAAVIVPLGLVEIACLVVYLVPRTAPLGAVLWTGYLGGAMATHVRVGNPLFSHVLFPIYIAALIWGGLWLRDARVRRFFGSRLG
ncbi:MAG TPA: DoxX family protein [Vicinamibacterales bacterium]|jgi:hypothetical protein|nr:DoxX family protein [Vicinamibacterales bacterium]